jgi:hypothetical protein
MHKEEIVDFIIKSITDDYYELGQGSGMQKEQVDQIVDQSNQTIVYIASGLYSRLKENNLLV